MQCRRLYKLHTFPVSLPEGIRNPTKVSRSNMFSPVGDSTMILQGRNLRYKKKVSLLSSCKVTGLIGG